MSRNFVLILLVCLGLFGAWQHFRDKSRQNAEVGAAISPSADGAVLVYGRDNCSYTQKTLAYLRSSKIPVTYVDIDYADASRAFHEKFDSTDLADDRGYALPIVEVAGRASMRPDPGDVVLQFRRVR